MTRDRAIIVVLASVIVGMLAGGNTIEGFGIGLLLGLVLGAMVGIAFSYGEPKRGADGA